MKDGTTDSMALNPDKPADETLDEHDSLAKIEEAPDPTPPADLDDEDDADDKPTQKKGDLPREEYQALKEARQQRREAREERDVAKARADALELEVALLKAEKEDPEPDDDAPPAEIKAWARRDAERRAKIATAKPVTTPAAPSPLDVQREAVRSEFKDFDRFVSKAVINRIDNDPTLHDRVWTSDNPPLEAYRVGRELILGEAKGATPRLSGGGGFRQAPGGSTVTTSISREERKIMAAMGVTEAEVLANRRARGGR